MAGKRVCSKRITRGSGRNRCTTARFAWCRRHATTWARCATYKSRHAEIQNGRLADSKRATIEATSNHPALKAPDWETTPRQALAKSPSRRCRKAILQFIFSTTGLTRSRPRSAGGSAGSKGVRPDDARGQRSREAPRTQIATLTEVAGSSF
jgi:hypothetical protein